MTPFKVLFRRDHVTLIAFMFVYHGMVSVFTLSSLS
jgi:hypothetical protein